MSSDTQTIDRPIGIFDSGLGGLTVAHAIREQSPHENILFLGDIARVPYGARSPETIRRYAKACATALQEHDIKMLVIACNTVSAIALDMLQDECAFPVLGVIEPGARTGVQAARGGHLGIIATQRTVASGAYIRAIKAMDDKARVSAYPAQLLVPLVEEGWLDGEVVELVVRHYLEPFIEDPIDVLILGCTHYPLLKAIIEEQLEALSGWAIPVVDSALATAKELKNLLEKEKMACSRGTEGALDILVTDMPETFLKSATRFFTGSIFGDRVTLVNI